MATLTHPSHLREQCAIPTHMQAAVYRGINDVRVETVPVPEIGTGEVLIRVHTCGICGTDLKKIHTGSHSAPRIFGHETSGVIAAIGTEVEVALIRRRSVSVGRRSWVRIARPLSCRMRVRDLFSIVRSIWKA